MDRELGLIASRFSLPAEREHENGGKQHESTNAKHWNDIAAGEIFKRSGNVARGESCDVPDRVDQGDTRGGRGAGEEPGWDSPEIRQRRKDRARGDGNHGDGAVGEPINKANGNAYCADNSRNRNVPRLHAAFVASLDHR